MKNILFPTDFSQTAMVAFEYALHIAQSNNANLHILHVSPKAKTIPPTEFVLQFSTNTNFERFGVFDKHMYSLHQAAQEKGFGKLFYSIQFKTGRLISKILEEITTKNIDFIISGTNGLTDVKKKLFGSNAIKILNNVPVPTLVIPLEASYKKAKEIGYTTIFKLSGMSVLRGVLDYSEKHNIRLNCLHITSNIEDPALSDTVRYWEHTFESNHIRFILKKQNHQEKYEIIQEFIEEYNIDYLCMMKQNLPFFKRLLEPSLSKKLAGSLKIPLFVVKEETE